MSDLHKVPTPTKGHAGEISLEQAAWVAETIVAALNATHPLDNEQGSATAPQRPDLA